VSPTPGRAEAVAPGIVSVLADNPSVFTGPGTGTLIVGAGSDVTVVDPGPDDPAHLAALLAAIGARRVRAILVTHNHIDHSPLARALADATGAAVAGAAPMLPEPALGAEGFDATYAPDQVLADGDTIGGDGWLLAAIATPGHTSNHLSFAWASAGLILTGDHVMGWSTSVILPPDGSMGAYMASLDRLLARPETRFLPTHGPAVENGHARVRALGHHRRLREDQIVTLLRERARTITAIVETLYAQVDRRLWPAAAKSVEAHLIWLAERGRARADGAVWSLA